MQTKLRIMDNGHRAGNDIKNTEKETPMNAQGFLQNVN